MKRLRNNQRLKKNDGREAQGLKKVYNHYVDKRKEIFKSAQFKVKDVFGDILSKDSSLPEQTTKPNKVLAKTF